MRISLVAAVSSNNVIGLDNRLPWHLPEDLRNFRNLTMGKPILMGRKTFESLKRPLPGRTNIVLSRTHGYRPEGCVVFPRIRDALLSLQDQEEIMVIGGASFYEQMLPFADRLYLTRIEREFVGDAFFPSFNSLEWTECSRQDFRQPREPYLAYSFYIYEKRRALKNVNLLKSPARRITGILQDP